MPLPVMTIEGDVVAIHSYWTDDGSRIVTEATVRTSDGTDVVVSQLGGSVDGIGMITMPGPPMLAPGMKVAVSAHRDVDLEQHEHIVLDSARVFAYPPSFVRTGPTKAGKYLFWESGCVFVTVDAPGTTAIPGDLEFAVIDASIEEWTTKTTACSYLKVVNEGREAHEVGRDNVNVIKFRDTTWCRPAVGKDAARCYGSSAAAVTTAVYVDDADSARDGAIIDADIELNGVNFAISVNGQSDSVQGCRSDLQNTLTHELGHLQGLEHPCRVGDDPPRVDNQGNAVPFCMPGLDPPKITDPTMYNFQDCGEIKKQTLSQDDIDAICQVYPLADDPGTCAEVARSSAGCCSASDRPDVSLMLAGATVLFMFRRRKTSPSA
jgi:hypothetical protein